jgi:ribonuclease E
MKMIMPSHAKNVKHYQDAMPLFARYQVESYLGGMFNPTVQLKSGGYIVIGVTEALVAIDVNSGRATKEGSIEETALKTNLEAAEEVARQLRLRDLAGLIVIDFIDMDERKNNNAVEKKLKDKLKTDRARIQVGRISGFGLLEMSRQRLRPGMLEATTQPCAHCHGTGLIRSDDSMALSILRQIEEEGVRRRSREVLVKCPVDVANYLMNQKREHVAQIEARYGLSVRIEGDPQLVSPDFTLEKFKTATRNVPEPTAVISADAMLMDAIDESIEEDETEAEDNMPSTEAEADVPSADEDDQKPKKRRRRRRRRRGNGNGAEGENGDNGSGDDQASDDSSDDADAKSDAAETETKSDEASEATDGAAEKPEGEEKPKRKRSRSRSRKKADTPKEDAAAADAPADEAKPEASEADTPAEVTAEAPVEAAEPAPAVEAEPAAEAPVETQAEAPVETPAEEPKVEAPAEEAPVQETPAQPEPELATAEADSAEADEPAKPKRRGWWSLGKS